MAKEKTVALLFGGESPEHEVSIQSAAKVASGLQALPGVKPVPVYVSKKGKWHWSRPSSSISAEDLVLAVTKEDGQARHYQPGGLDFAQALLHLTVDEYATILIMIHGSNGEDGRLQGAFELAGLRYTGSGSAASALALDKPRCQAVLAARGLPVPPFRTLDARSIADPVAMMDVMDSIGFPCVVKPALGGSSVGVSIVSDGNRLGEALRKALEFGSVVHVEKFLNGQEFTCAVLARSQPEALPVIEIFPPEGRFFDYEAKYVAGVSREVCPAKIDSALAEKIQNLAVETHRAIGCEGFSRVDFICENGQPRILEINTIPGMTATSLVPQAAAAAGISFSQLVGIIVDHSLSRGASAPAPAHRDA